MDSQHNLVCTQIFYIGRTYCIFCNTFTVLNILYLYNIEFYLQNVFQFNDNVNIHTLVNSPILNISV